MTVQYDLYKTLFDEMSEGAYILDPEGFIIELNHAALTLFGYAFREIERAPVQTLFSGAAPFDQLNELHEQVGTVTDFEATGRGKNGERIPCHITSIMQKDETDRPLAYLGIVRPLSLPYPVDKPLPDQHQLDKKLISGQLPAKKVNGTQNGIDYKAQYEFLKQVIDLNPEFVFVKDKNGRYTIVNQAFADRYQMKADQILGKTDKDLAFVSPDKIKRFHEADLAIMDSKQHTSIVEDQVPFPDGSLRWLQTTKRPIFDKDGNATHLLAISTDVTTQKESFKTIRDREQFLQTILNTLPGAVFWKDRNSVFLGCNEYVAKIAGTTTTEIVGKTDYDLPWTKEEADAFRADDAEVMESGVAKLGIIEPQLQADGTRAWLETNKIPLIDAEGEVYGVLGSFRDITETIKLQEQVQRSLEKRSRQVALSTKVAQEIASVTDLTELYEQIVTQVKEQFEYYHVQLLRYDPSLDTVALIAGYGEIGQKMLAMNHAMPMGIGLIGTAAEKGQSVLRTDTSLDPHWKSNPLLPHTKGEIAVPIKSGDNILGVLDVQTDQVNELTEEDQLLLEGLCGQIAIAIESTNLRQELESQLRELMTLQQRLSREGWRKYRDVGKFTADGFQFDHVDIRPFRIKEEANGAVFNRSASNLAAPGQVQTPLKIRGQIVGQLAIHENENMPLKEDERLFLDAISSEIASAIEAARLFEETENALEIQERLATELETVAKVSTAASTILDAQELMQSVVDFTKESFRLYHAHIYLVNNKGTHLELVAGSGAAGQLMSLEGHKISVTDDSLVARSARTRSGVLENDIRKTINFLPNPMLPNIKAEIAAPMIVGDRLVGVLDLQSDQVGAFSGEDLRIFQILAAQIAVAYENAKQYSEQVEMAKKLREVDQVKNEFLASMSHELRTPLNSIIGFADVLLEGLDGDLNDRMEEDVQLIRQSGAHLRELIGDILDMSKIEAGKMDLRFEPVDLVQLAQDIIKTANPLAHEKALDLLLDIEGDVPLIEADRTRLRQVLWNIMGNAIKFTEKGSVTLRIAPKAEHLLIAIRDTGIGIEESHISIVFEQFRQVDGSLERIVGGTGLGMPISKKLVELHGGDIWVESVVGQGSTFLFTLPYQRPQGEK